MDTDDAMAVHAQTFEARPEQVGEARRWVGKMAGDHPRLADLELLVSELAANAVLHSRSRNGGTFEVTIVRRPGEVRVYVTDAGGAGGSVPYIPAQRTDMPGGHGLRLVDALAARWGYEAGAEDDEAGGMTWFVLPELTCLPQFC